MRKCPYCAEEIQDEAIKCKHCGEWLGKDAQVPPQLIKATEVEPLVPPEPKSEDIALSEPDEEIKRKIEAGQKQCPACGNWDVYRAFIEDGGQGDWCPHCKKSIKEGKLFELQVSTENIRPWARFWARHCDYLIFFFLVGIVGYLIAPSIMGVVSSKENEAGFTFLLIFLYNFFEAGLLSTWGYTPGKWLLGILVRDYKGNKLNYSKAFVRAITVWWRGMGIGFPIVYLFTQINAYNKLKKNGITSWDKNGLLIVTHHKINPIKEVIVFIIYVGFIILIILDRI